MEGSGLFRVSKGVREDSRINLTTLSKPSNFLINSLLHRLLEAVSKNDCTASSRLLGKRIRIDSGGC